MVDNAFDYIEDFEKAQKLSDTWTNLIKKIGKTYKYYITKLREEAIITA